MWPPCRVVALTKAWKLRVVGGKKSGVKRSEARFPREGKTGKSELIPFIRAGEKHAGSNFDEIKVGTCDTTA